MRRRGLLIGLGGITGMSGCLSDSENASTPTEDSTAEPMDSTELGERTTAGMQLSITGFQVFEQVQRVDGEVRIPEDSQDTLLAIQFRTETIVESPVSHPTDSELVAIVDNQQFEPVDIEGEPSEPVSGKQYTGTDDARSGVVSEGWLFYEIPEGAQQATISWSDSVDDAQAEWSLRFTAKDKAEISVTAFSGPASVERYEPVTLTVTAENTGGRTGDAYFRIFAEMMDEGPLVNFEVPAGETAEETYEIPYPSSAGLGAEYELLDVYEETVATATVDYTIPVRSFGETFTTPSGTEVVVSNLRFTDDIEFEYGDAERPGRGDQFAYVTVGFTTDADGGYVPTDGSVVAEVSGEVYEEYSVSDFALDLTDPDVSTYGQSFNSLSANVSEEAVMFFDIPASADSDDVSILWSDDISSYSNDGVEIRARWE